MGMRAVYNAANEKLFVDKNVVDENCFTGDVLFARFVVQCLMTND